MAGAEHPVKSDGKLAEEQVGVGGGEEKGLTSRLIIPDSRDRQASKGTGFRMTFYLSSNHTGNVPWV